MQALQFAAPREARVIDIPEPAAPGPGEALVRVHRVGVCGTDLSGYLGKMPFFSYPRIPGHELGVEVTAVGPDVTHVCVGDRCSVEPYLNDPASYASGRGKSNCCENLQVLGVHCDGGLRPYFTLPARKLHPAEELDFDQLALVETLAIGCHAVSRAAPAQQDACLILGAGPIGLATLQFVLLAGSPAIVVDLNAARLEFCAQAFPGARTLLGGPQLADDLRGLNGGRLPDVVFDATGSAASMSRAFELVGHGGKLVFVGITTEEVRFRHAPFHRVEGTLLCTRNALPDDFRRIIAWIAAGRIDTRPWITHRTTLAAAAGEFERYVQPDTRVVKAMIEVEA